MTRSMLKPRSVPVLAACIALFSGCANMSGLDGTTEYGCKAPQGVQCDSVSGNYYNAIQNNLPSQRQGSPDGASEKSEAIRRTTPAARAAASSIEKQEGLQSSSVLALPLRSQARVLRLWFKPWEDADHDLYDQGYVYVQIDNGRWMIDHAQRRIRDTYAPIRAPRKAPAQSVDATAKASEAALPARPPANVIPPLPALTGSGDPAGINTP